MQGLSQLGALVFVMGLSSRYAIYRQQLLGGVWINQTLPAVVLGLYTRWLNPWALLAGWGSASPAGPGWPRPSISPRHFR